GLQPEREAITLPFEAYLIPADVEVGCAVEDAAAIDFVARGIIRRLPVAIELQPDDGRSKSAPGWKLRPHDERQIEPHAAISGSPIEVQPFRPRRRKLGKVRGLMEPIEGSQQIAGVERRPARVTRCV